MNTLDSIVAKKPHENAGALAANRFAYIDDICIRIFKMKLKLQR